MDKYSASVKELTRILPFSVYELDCIEKLLKRRNTDYSQSAILNWCNVAVKYNVAPYDLIIECILVPIGKQ